MAAGLSRIRDVFRFYSRVFCFAAEEFFLPHGLGRQAPVAAGETFFRVHGSWRVCPAGLFRTGASSACSGDGCFAGGGERAWRLNKKRRRRCACTVSGDGSDRERSGFSAGGYLCKTASVPLPEEREMTQGFPAIPLPERERYLEKRAVSFFVPHFRRPPRNPGALLRFWRSGPDKARQGRTGAAVF